MIESPIVSTCRGATGTTGSGGAGGVTEEEGAAVGLGVPVFTSSAAEVVIGVGEGATTVDEDCATAVENSPATVMSEPAATVARTTATARDHLGVGEADIGLQLLHQSVRLGVNPAAHTLALNEESDTSLISFISDGVDFASSRRSGVLAYAAKSARN